jgi:hypothetical protein
MDEHEVADALREAIDTGTLAELAHATTDAGWGSAAGFVIGVPEGRFLVTVVQIEES